MRKDAMTIKPESSGLDLSMKRELPKLRDLLDVFQIWQGENSKTTKPERIEYPNSVQKLLFNSLCTAEETTLNHGIWVTSYFEYHALQLENNRDPS